MCPDYPDFTDVARPTRAVIGTDQLRWYFCSSYDLAANTAVTLTLTTLDTDERLYASFIGCSRKDAVADPSQVALLDDATYAIRNIFDRSVVLNPGGESAYDFAPGHAVKVKITNYDAANSHVYYYFVWGVIQYE